MTNSVSAYLDGMDQTYYQGWSDPATDRLLYFDAYGKRAEYFNLDVGTTVEGGVTVRPLADGRAHVSILIHTRNAICWGFQGDGEGAYFNAFGYAPKQVSLRLGAASLGDGIFTDEYTMPSPESPLLGPYPDERIATVINCSGELRYGSGFPDGTPGRAHTTQEILLNTGVPSGCPATDCVPTEKIDFKPVGK